jgi:hypothetical protein
MDILVFLAGQRANLIRSPCNVCVAHKRRKPHAPHKPTKHFTAHDLVAKAIKPIIDAFQRLHNRHRPHGTVGGLAPVQYLAELKAKDISQPQRCA